MIEPAAMWPVALVRDWRDESDPPGPSGCVVLTGEAAGVPVRLTISWFADGECSSAYYGVLGHERNMPLGYSWPNGRRWEYARH